MALIYYTIKCYQQGLQFQSIAYFILRIPGPYTAIVAAEEAQVNYLPPPGAELGFRGMALCQSVSPSLRLDDSRCQVDGVPLGQSQRPFRQLLPLSPIPFSSLLHSPPLEPQAHRVQYLHGPIFALAAYYASEISHPNNIFFVCHSRPSKV